MLINSLMVLLRCLVSIEELEYLFGRSDVWFGQSRRSLLMGRFVGLRLTRRSGLMLIHVCAVVLVGVAMVNVPQHPTRAPSTPAAHSRPLLNQEATPTPLPASPTASVSVTPVSTHSQSESQAPADLSWLVEGVAVLFLILLGFGLILVPIVVRSSRIERRRRLSFPLEPVAQEKLEAQLTRVVPERKAPLSRAQMQALRDEARRLAVTSESSAVRLVNGLPLSLPIAEAEPLPQLPAPRRPVVTRKLENHALQTDEHPESSDLAGAARIRDGV